MKVTIRNLGVIKDEAIIDLKPLTVLIGPNNAGKTWIAYALGGIFSSYGSTRYSQAYADRRISDRYEVLEDAINNVLTKDNATIDLRRFAEESGNTYFNNVAKHARTWMHRFLSTQLAHFDDLDISLDLMEYKEKLLDRISLYALTSRVAGSALTIRKDRNDNKVFAFTSTDSQEADGREEGLGEIIPPAEVRERLVGYISTALRRSLYLNTYFFPTERTALVTARFAGQVINATQPQISEKAREALEILAKELDSGELASENNANRDAIGPVGAFMTMLSRILSMRSRNMSERLRQADKDPAIKRYIQLADILENQILAGNVYLSTSEPDPGREVLFDPAQDVHLEIPIASSMVKELAPLALYLRYLARPGELLIIDEPEMNLHPAAQVKIVEFLTMLVNAGLHVLITSHSTYLIDHLANLMDAYKHGKQDEIKEMFLLEQKESFIAQEKVAVYSVEDGKVKNILSPEGSIDWQTFSEITALVEHIHFELAGE